MRKTIFTLIVLGIFAWQGAQAQALERSVIGAQGATQTAGDITVEWTLGELAVDVLKSDARLLTEGFHQPVIRVQLPLIDVDVDGEEPSVYENTILNIKVFPNPVIALLNIEIEHSGHSRMHVHLTDMLGVTHAAAILDTTVTQFEMDLSALSDGIYFMRFISPWGKTIATRKIIKTGNL